MKIRYDIDVKKDGISYINMYSKANTAFGRMLSNFYPCTIHTEDGTFRSVEAYWYYLSLPASVNRDSIRRLYGYQAKKKGRELRAEAGEANLLFDDRFEEKILSAIRQKVQANASLFKKEYRNLPIIHYYVFDGKQFDVTDDFPWLINGITEIVKSIHG